jgi:hypothetical protein
MSLAHYAMVHTRSWAVNSSNDRARLSAKKDQLDQEIGLLREEIRIKDERLARIPASQRPHYRPTASPSWSCALCAVGRWRKPRGSST